MTADEYKRDQQTEFDKPVTLGVLLEFTDSFLIPKMAELIKDESGSLETKMNEKIKDSHAKLENNLKTFIDRKFSDYTTDTFKRLDEKYRKEKDFKEKVLELFRKHKIGSSEDLAYLEGLVQAS